MATCKDCAHYNLCNIKQRYNHSKYALQHIEKYCEHFKGSSRFVELPCKIGDVVWFIKGRKNSLVRCGKVKEIILNEFFVYIVRCTCQNFTGVFDVSVFSTQKEAEQALTKRNQPDNTPQ